MDGQVTGVLICFFIVMLRVRRPNDGPSQGPSNLFSLRTSFPFFALPIYFWLCFLYGAYFSLNIGVINAHDDRKPSHLGPPTLIAVYFSFTHK